MPSTLTPKLKFEITELIDKRIYEKHVTREDFTELKNVVKELAHAQKRTEVRVGELAHAQKRTEDELVLFHRDFVSKTGGLGARWGMMAESTFRNAIEGILSETGFKTERVIARDEGGVGFGYPEEIELDVIIQNSKLFIIEIKSSISKGDVSTFDKKVKFYEKQGKQSVHKKVIISPYLEPAAIEFAKRLGIEVFTEINEVKRLKKV